MMAFDEALLKNNNTDQVKQINEIRLSTAKIHLDK
jgi:hypothetical protein